jgi:vesicle transport protein SEC22
MHSSVSIYIYILVNELPSRVAVLIHIFLLCTDTFIQKTRKLYLDTRTQRNLSKLNDDLFEVQQIMTRNIQEVLGVGDRLDQVSQMSSRLSSESRIFADKAKDLNRQAFIRKWAPVAIVVGIVVLLLWFRRYFWG